MMSYLQTLWLTPQGPVIVLLVAALVTLLVVFILFAIWALKTKSKLNDAVSDLLQETIKDSAMENRVQTAQAVEQSNSQLRIELNEMVGQLRQSQTDSMVNFAKIVHNMTQESTNTQITASRAFNDQVAQMTTQLNQELEQIRTTLNTQLQTLQSNNDEKLEAMRMTVETKLQTTLESRLSESFRQVAGHLKDVETGLGEMRAIASEVGELKRVLTNVKSRGTFGEVQLGAILENIIPNYYEENVATRPGSNDRVEFAIKMPGKTDDATVWLPIDSKFPMEDYLRIEEAREAGDKDAIEKNAKALEARLKNEAKKIHDKYVQVPYTTEFAILFLPSESLYAECLRRPGVIEELQNQYRVTVAGPTVLSALLNSLLMGFRTLALEERSAQVWQILSHVKAEFARFAEALEAMDKKVEGVKNAIGSVKTRTRQMDKRLRDVELPGYIADSVEQSELKEPL